MYDGPSPGNAIASYRATQESLVGSGLIRERDSIAGEFKGLDEAVGMLHGVLDQLENRLDPVLTPAPPTPASPANAPPAEALCSQVVLMVRADMRGVRLAVDRLQRVLQRLEL